MPFPVTVDLLAMARALESRGGKRDLSDSLRAAWRAQSCLADLRNASEVCEVFDQLPPGAIGPGGIGPGGITHIKSALLTSAILLYVRATATGGSKTERGSIQLDLKKLNLEQRNDHKTLINIRNGAIGHVEAGATIGGDLWHADYLFAKEASKSAWRIASGSTSIGFNVDTLAALKRQLPVALEAVGAKCRRRLDHIHKTLDAAKVSRSTMLRYSVDPIDYFGSVESARMMLSGNPGDEMSQWMPLR